jgi:hypothetical protein
VFLTRNVGALDRGIRLLLAGVAVALALARVVSGAMVVVLALVAVMLVATSIIGVCPLYLPFRWSTRRRSDRS